MHFSIHYYILAITCKLLLYFMQAITLFHSEYYTITSYYTFHLIDDNCWIFSVFLPHFYFHIEYDLFIFVFNYWKNWKLIETNFWFVENVKFFVVTLHTVDFKNWIQLNVSVMPALYNQTYSWNILFPNMAITICKILV